MRKYKGKTAYNIIISKAKNNYSASCKDFPGIVATGETRGEAMHNMTGAIKFHLEGVNKRGV